MWLAGVYEYLFDSKQENMDDAERWGVTKLLLVIGEKV